MTDLGRAAFRRLVEHLRERTDVQNIDMMNLAGFCRNCLSNWYREAANEAGVRLDKGASRKIVYGMPYRNGGRATSARRATRRRRPSRSTAPGIDARRMGKS